MAAEQRAQEVLESEIFETQAGEYDNPAYALVRKLAYEEAEYLHVDVVTVYTDVPSKARLTQDIESHLTDRDGGPRVMFHLEGTSLRKK